MSTSECTRWPTVVSIASSKHSGRQQGSPPRDLDTHVKENRSFDSHTKGPPMLSKFTKLTTGASAVISLQPLSRILRDHRLEGSLVACSLLDVLPL
jgi:hypothetical protein